MSGAAMRRKPAAAAFLVFLAAASAAGASSLLDYEKRVVRAGEQADRMKRDKVYIEDDVATIKSLLPASEEVRSGDQSITADNKWLHSALDSYVAEKNAQEKTKKLDEIKGRLKALDDELRKVLSPRSATGSETTREKMEAILNRAEFRPKTENRIAAMIKTLKARAVELIQKLYLKVFNAIFGEGAEGNPIYRGVIIAALIGVGAVVVRMALGLRRGEKKRKKKREVLGEEIEAGVSAGDLAGAALAAARAGDFRTGMRKLYIALLYELADRNLVEIERDTTNHEYLAQVASVRPLAGPMTYLTDRFDYFWYGMFPSSEEDFSSYFVRYKEALESARSLGLQAG